MERLTMPSPQKDSTAACPHASTPTSSVMLVHPPAFRHLLIPFCLLLSLISYRTFVVTVHAQSATATLSGTVVDENGAVVPNVNIAVISLVQGFQRSTATNSEGAFVVPLLPPGTYNVKAEHD